MPARNPGTSGCASAPALTACACTALPSRSAPARPHAWSTRAHAYPSAGTPRACISRNTAMASPHSSASASMATCLFHSTASLPSDPAASSRRRRLEAPRPRRARRSTSAHATWGSRKRPALTTSECSCGANRRARPTRSVSSSPSWRRSAHWRSKETRSRPSRKESTPRSPAEIELILRR
uniref:Uncharacterized protein n=1 Tax=Arundo donax TaxID=35708 RepID=A0A0A8ZKZ3_ARUDO